MENPREDLASALERITARLNELESRVSTLEHPRPDGFVRPLPPSPAIAESHPLAQLSRARTMGAVPAVGKLFLGIAGGYLLRALAESGAIPQLATVLLAMVYAAGWLVWAARMPDEARFASVGSAATAALIFSPMLWEVTLRFKVLPDGVSAGVLCAFVGLASALAWKRKLTWVAWIATFLPAVTALMLLVATHNPAPFASALLLIALFTEYAGLHDRWRSLRPVVALLADSTILVLIILYSGQAEVPLEYKSVMPAVLMALTLGLFTIYGISLLLSTVMLQQRIGVFETGQIVTAFALAVVTILRMTHHAAASQLGAFCLFLAGACYVAALTRFDSPLQMRNYHTFATWGAALVVMGSFLLFHAATVALCLSAAAVVATLCGIRFDRWVLGFHGAVYLGTAGYVSGLWDYTARALVGPLSPPSDWSLWTTVFSGFICCVAVWWKRDCGAHQMQSLLLLFFASLATYATAALAVAGIVWVSSSGFEPAASRLAVIRTLILCVVILALSFSGARWNRAELIWIAYLTIAFCTVKLVYEDLRHGTAGSLAISLFLYGVIWVLVPRWARLGARPT